MWLHMLVDPCWCVYVVLFGSRILTILTTVTLANTRNALSDDGVTAPKHVGAVLMSILMYLNFKIVFKTIYLFISWWINKTLIISRCCTVCMWTKRLEQYTDQICHKNLWNYGVKIDFVLLRKRLRKIGLGYVSLVTCTLTFINLSLISLTIQSHYRSYDIDFVWHFDIVLVYLSDFQTFFTEYFPFAFSVCCQGTNFVQLLISKCTVQYSTGQYITVQYSTVQYSTVQYITVQYSTVQYSTVQ